MNKWKAYGSVSDLVKQFENTPPQSNIDLKRSHSLENIKKSRNFRVVYDKFENKDPDTVESPLRKHASTNHLECLQLQEINQVRKQLYAISGKLHETSDLSSYAFYLREVSQLIVEVGNVADYGYAAIKSEKVQVLSFLQRYYMHIREKLKNQNYNFEEDESVKGLVVKSDNVERKSPPTPSVRSRTSNSDAKAVGNSGLNGIGSEIKKKIQRKYERNPTNAQHTNQDPPKNVSNISRKISRLQHSIDQEAELRPKNKVFSPQTPATPNQNNRHTWDSMPSVNNVNNKFTYPGDNHHGQHSTNKWENLSDSSSFKSVYSAKSADNHIRNNEKPTNNFFNGEKSKPLYQSAKYDARGDSLQKSDNASNSSGSGQHRNSWNSFASTQDILSNQDNRYDTESDTASIVSGNDMFEQKYSGIAERINKVLKKRISLLEEDGLMN